MKRKKQYKCDICKDTGHFTNPFDQEIKCKCQYKKRKRTDYRGFVLHLLEWEDKGIPHSMSDLRNLAIKYNCPIPKKYR